MQRLLWQWDAGVMHGPPHYVRSGVPLPWQHELLPAHCLWCGYRQLLLSCMACCLSLSRTGAHTSSQPAFFGFTHLQQTSTGSAKPPQNAHSTSCTCACRALGAAAALRAGLASCCAPCPHALMIQTLFMLTLRPAHNSRASQLTL
jgi:hypothetical protein